MRVPESWLRSEYCDPGPLGRGAGGRARHALRSRSSGSPTSARHRPMPSWWAGWSRSRSTPTPTSLSVCEVDAGEGGRTIVCGAPNVAAGQTVPVALPGAVMPDGTKLGKAKLRGVESDGMILSEAELEIGDDADGIAVLTEDGVRARNAALAEVIPVSEPVIELEPTSNRVDCFGVYGVARELHAVTALSWRRPPWDEDAEADRRGQGRRTTPRSPSRCRSSARGSRPGSSRTSQIGPSPLWLKARLIGAGMRPINNVVDITNYVMLMTAQPLHALRSRQGARRSADHPHREARARR